jgi:Protein of unknown function (DUF2408)
MARRLLRFLLPFRRKFASAVTRTRVDGKFLGPGGVMPSSQAVCTSLLEECFDIAQEIKANEDSKNVPSSLKPIYDRLRELRSELESMVLTHRWTLRETDLWNYSLSLQEIDKMRVEGKFVDSEGNRPEGQYVSLPLARRKEASLTALLKGLALLAQEMLWLDLSATFLKRARLRRAYAHRMYMSGILMARC